MDIDATPSTVVVRHNTAVAPTPYAKKTEKEQAKKKYISALSASVRGTGTVFLKRNPKDIFCNNFNPNLMLIHGANHDVQMVVDQYACAQYICGYLTKNEAGMSNLLKNVNDSADNLDKMSLLNKLASVWKVLSIHVY